MNNREQNTMNIIESSTVDQNRAFYVRAQKRLVKAGMSAEQFRDAVAAAVEDGDASPDVNGAQRAFAILADWVGDKDAGAILRDEQGPSDVWDTDKSVKGNHPCGRCAGTGRFITYVENGKPRGPGGMCFRCDGKGFHDQKDRARNEYHDTHQTVSI